MKDIFKMILKYLFANTKLDEKVSNVLETAKSEIVELDKKFDSLKEEVEKQEESIEEAIKEEILKPKKQSKKA